MLYRQAFALAKEDPTLSPDDIALALGCAPEAIRTIFAAPSPDDIPVLLGVSKQLALNPATKDSTRQAAVEFLVDELKGRNDARHRHLNANTELSVKLIASLESAQQIVPESVRRRQILNVTPTTNAEAFTN